jgi:uncharacterized protein (DUF1810 family)
MSLQRFYDAQSHGAYAQALAEMRRGQKTSHWIWYIFPQIDGLGHSSTARDFALRDLDEACAYLRDPLLRKHYEEIARVVAEQLSGGVKLGDLMGSSIDALKLVSSITLFRAAAVTLAKDDPAFEVLMRCCDGILQQVGAQGYEPCAFTLDRLAGVKG